MRPLQGRTSAHAIAESVRTQLGTDALVLILPGTPTCAVVVATDPAIASALSASAVRESKPSTEAVTVRSGDGRLAYSVTEAAEALGVSRDIIYDELRSGRLDSIKIGRRRLITRQQIDGFLAGIVR